MAEIKTVQQYYASAQANNRALSNPEGNRTYALEIPENIQLFKLSAEMVNIIDIIPFPITNPKHPLVHGGSIKPDGSSYDDIFVYYEHRDINSNGDIVPCNHMLYGEPCAVCDERNRLYEAEKEKGNPEPWKKPEVERLSYKVRVGMNVIDTRNKDKGIQLLLGSDFLLRRGILSGAKVNKGDSEDANSALAAKGDTFTIEVTDWKSKATTVTEYVYFASPANGFSVEIKGQNEVFAGSDYVKPVSFGLRERKQQYQNDIVQHAFDISSFIKKMTYAEVKQLLFGTTTTTTTADTTVVDTPAKAVIDATDTVQVSKVPNDTVQVVKSPVAQEGPPSDVGMVPQGDIADTPEKLCSFGHKMGLDYETKAECSDCLDADPKQYSECRKERKAIDNI